jgi:sulfatase maturation enzyme AslB (radical SAM superfamily)
MVTCLYLMPTLECNCRCSYCYIPEAEKVPSEEQCDFTPVLNHFIENFPARSGKRPQLRFIGGEPCLEKQAIMEMSGVFFRAFPRGLVVVNTNGTLLTPEYARAAARYGDRFVHVVSLDGTETVHNARRRMLCGGNAFEKAMEGITTLQDAGLPVYCNMVLDETTIEGLDALCVLLKGHMGMNSLSVSLVSGEGIPIHREKKLELLCRAYSAADEHGMALGGHHRLLLGSVFPALRCTAGTGTAVVAPDLRVYACQRFTGRVEAPPWEEGMALENSAGACRVSLCCYDEDALWLGEKLHAMYLAQYPSYLGVSTLDEHLFGVI